MRSQLRTRLVTVCSVCLVILAVTGTYLYFAWWMPNRQMVDMEWWQTASQDEMRSVCHKVLRFPLGNHHDAFLTLANIGNAESVPLLVKSLKWQDAPDETDFTVCTTEHAVEALQSLTGEKIGFAPEKWEQWWAESGSKLPAASFYPRGGKVSHSKKDGEKSDMSTSEKHSDTALQSSEQKQ